MRHLVSFPTRWYCLTPPVKILYPTVTLLRLLTTTSPLSFDRHELLQSPLTMSYGGSSENDADEQDFLSPSKGYKASRRYIREKRKGPTKQQRKAAAAFKEKQTEKKNEKQRLAAFINVPPNASPSPHMTLRPTSLMSDVASAEPPLAEPLTSKTPSTSQSAFSYHYETTPPSPSQLQAANKFFLAQPAKPLFFALQFHKQPLTGIPEVCFLGRSNAGKSSLLNALTGQKDLCSVSAQPGRTRHMGGYAVGGSQSDGKEGRLVMMDMPGYGKGSRPEWGREILKYLAQRKELRRVFVVIDAEVGLKSSDEEMLALLRQQGISHQILLGKVDKALSRFMEVRTGKKAKDISKERDEASSMESLRKRADEVMALVQPKGGGGPGALGEILCVASEGGERNGVKKKKGLGLGLGLDALRWAILQATGLNWTGEVMKAEQMLGLEEGGDSLQGNEGNGD